MTPIWLALCWPLTLPISLPNALPISLPNALSNASIERIKHVKQCFKQCFLHGLKTVLLPLWLVISALSRRPTLGNSGDSEYLLLPTSFFLRRTVSTFYFIRNNANWLNRTHSSWLDIELSTDLSAELSTDLSTDLPIEVLSRTEGWMEPGWNSNN